MKVLVAGSEPVSRVVLETALARAGHAVVSVRSGRAALQVLEGDAAPTVVFLDSGLPGKDALAVCRDLRSKGPSAGPAPYVVVITSGGPSREREAAVARDAGADDTVHRPLTGDVVVARMATAARIVQTRDQVAAATQVGEPAPAPAKDRLVGTTVDDKYEIQAVLGQGGMGTVYKARHALVDELVAFKVIHPALTLRHGFRERFVREAKTMMRIAHPNVVAVRDCGVTRGALLYMTLDYSPGRSLGDVLRSVGRMDEARAVRLASQIAAGLAAAHARGVVHRDLKPDNILVESDDRVRVCDFGLAKLLNGDDDVEGAANISGIGIVIGTPYYMAPEQAAAGDVDGRSDLYALGCILYELVCGARVFDGNTASRLMRSHLFEAPTPPTKRGVELSPGLEALILRLLAKDPENRPSSAAAVVEALEALGTRRGPARKLRVLIADDSGVNRALLSGMLVRWGHQVVQAKDGEEAVELFGRRGPFDAVLLDGEMPRMDGPEAAKRIREAERAQGATTRTPIVALTSNSGSTDRARCVEAGMDDGIGKPIRPDELAAVLSRLTRTSAAAAASDDTDLFDRRTALSRVEGDEGLLRETVGLFLEEERRVVGDLRRGLAAREVDRVARAAHELKGSAGNMALVSVARTAARVEGLARAGNLVAVQSELDHLERELTRARPILSALAAPVGVA